MFNQTPKPASRAAQKEHTGRAVLEAAREEFERVGFEAANLRAIAARAGVSAGTVIHHFKDKRELLHAALFDDLELTLEKVLADPGPGPLEAQLKRLTRGVFRYYQRRPALSRAMLRESLFAEGTWGRRFTGQVGRTHGVVAGLATGAIARKELRAGTNAPLFAAAWFSFFYFALIGWVQGGQANPAALVERMVEQHLEGLRPEEPMKSMFKSEQAKQVLTQWYERFRARIPSPTQSRVVPTSFGPTHVLVGGPEGAPPLVLLHGAMATSAHALVELAGLLTHFRVYALDVLGQSVMSADARPSVSNDEYGRWLVEVLDGLALPQAHVVGISWGGFVSIRLAALAPQRINRLVLLVPAGVVTGPAWAGFTKMGLPMALYLMSPSEQRLRNFTRHLLTTQDDDWMKYLGDAFRSFNMNMKVPALVKPGELKELTAPTLVMAADQDISFPGEKLLARATELFPSLAGTELIKDCNHCPPTTDVFRQWLAGRITGFLIPN